MSFKLKMHIGNIDIIVFCKKLLYTVFLNAGISETAVKTFATTCNNIFLVSDCVVADQKLRKNSSLWLCAWWEREKVRITEK